MSTQSKRLHFAPDPPEDYTRALSDLGRILAKILYNRGLTTPESVDRFLSDDFDLYDPFLMDGMSRVVSRIRNAVRRRERIVVYGDFDADGVTSTALMVQTLEALGAQAIPYIPDRVDEGYGLNVPALTKMAEDGVSLVVTVDCGIRSIAEVQTARQAGLDIIITDHHSVGEQLPDAYAILNPKQVGCKYPEDMLAGVGVAFKLASALLKVAHAQDRIPPNLTEHDLLDLVAIGTVADLVPLDRPENRHLVKLGLRELVKARRPGVYALMNVSNIRPSQTNTISIGYALGPRINAAGRLSHAEKAYQLLTTKDSGQAAALANELQAINQRRQQLTTDSYRLARQQAVDGDDVPYLVFAADPSFLPGIVGLVAGKLTEEFYRPSVVIDLGEEESHGSCRSIPEFDITNALDQCADLLVRHGGHAQAAGFSVLTKNIEAFKQRLSAIAEAEIAGLDLRPTLTIDDQVEMIDLTMELARDLQLLEPLGTDNPEPIFYTRRLRIVDARRVGNEGHHLKLRLADGPLSVDAIAFRFGPVLPDLSNVVDVAYHLQINQWNQRESLQMNVVDIRSSER